jgi:ribosome maturation factor RimP
MLSSRQSASDDWTRDARAAGPRFSFPGRRSPSEGSSVELETPLRSLLAERGLDLYDVEFASGTLTVTVHRPGGVDVDALADANHVISTWLDEHDPIPGRYTLDVASPGLERRLRTPAHFAAAVGERVTLRERRTGEATRRLEGVVLASTATSVTLEEVQLGVVEVPLDAVERARTVFLWGAAPKPSPSKGRPATERKK